MKRSISLLIAAILGTAYVIYLISYFGSSFFSDSSSEVIAGGIATMLVAPHMALVLLATIFNWLGYLLRLKWAALVAGILYAVGMVMFLMYFMFVVIEMILCFIGYAKMKKQDKLVA